jgi:hypothetical protein
MCLDRVWFNNFIITVMNLRVTCRRVSVPQGLDERNCLAMGRQTGLFVATSTHSLYYSCYSDPLMFYPSLCLFLCVLNDLSAVFMLWLCPTFWWTLICTIKTSTATLCHEVFSGDPPSECGISIQRIRARVYDYQERQCACNVTLWRVRVTILQCKYNSPFCMYCCCSDRCHCEL